MPTTKQPEATKQPKKRPDPALKIRQGKTELNDEELTTVSGGQQSNKRFTCIE
jgi:bacteriocin-like protein